MKRVATAVILTPLVLLAVFKAPLWLFAIIVCALAVLATREYLNIIEHYGLKPFRNLVYVLVLLVYASAVAANWESPFLPPSSLGNFNFVLVVGTFVMLALAMRYQDSRTALISAAASSLGLLYVALPLLLIVEWIMPSDDLTRAPAGRFRVFAVLLYVWGGDTFAYYIGRFLGRHKMAPRISPGKTWEGAAGSLVGSIVAALVVWRLQFKLHPFTPTLGYWMGAAIVVNVAAQIGDLVESMMKRGAGIKDSGSLLPGHGGILDRIDALLFAVPAMWYYPMIFYPLRDILFRHS